MISGIGADAFKRHKVFADNQSPITINRQHRNRKKNTHYTIHHKHFYQRIDFQSNQSA